MGNTEKAPRQGQLSPFNDERFEELITARLRKTDAARWPTHKTFWSSILQAKPATAKRILCVALELATNQGQPAPSALVELIKDILVKGTPTKRTKLADAQKRAAELIADDPALSDAVVAKRVGASRESVCAWKRQHRFKWMLLESQVDILIEVQRQYERKFGHISFDIPITTENGLAEKTIEKDSERVVNILTCLRRSIDRGLPLSQSEIAQFQS